MLWHRVESYRLEGEHNGEKWSIETYWTPRSVSTHVRKNGAIQTYEKSEYEALRFVELQTNGVGV